jgi:hypothetical protein
MLGFPHNSKLQAKHTASYHNVLPQFERCKYSPFRSFMLVHLSGHHRTNSLVDTDRLQQMGCPEKGSNNHLKTLLMIPIHIEQIKAPVISYPKNPRSENITNQPKRYHVHRSTRLLHLPLQTRPMPQERDSCSQTYHSRACVQDRSRHNCMGHMRMVDCERTSRTGSKPIPQAQLPIFHMAHPPHSYGTLC